MAEIYLGLSENATLSQQQVGNVKSRELRYYVPKNVIVIDHDKRQTPYFWLEKVDELRKRGFTNIASHENPLYTHAAGAVSIFHNDRGEIGYVSFSQKDDQSPRDPGFRVPRNGFPNNEEDWFTNNHLYKEAWEEGILLTRGNELVLTQHSMHDELICQVAQMFQSKTGLKISGTRRIPIIFRNGYDTLHVYREGEKQPRLTDKGIISWTPEIGHCFIKIMEVQYPISELYLIDGEIFSNGDPIRRDVCVIDLNHLRGKKFADPIHEQVHRYKNDNVEIFERDDIFLTDKVPRSTLNQVMIDGEPVYPIDWMDESYEFLSDQRSLRNFSLFGWSELEKRLKAKK